MLRKMCIVVMAGAGLLLSSANAYAAVVDESFKGLAEMIPGEGTRTEMIGACDAWIPTQDVLDSDKWELSGTIDDQTGKIVLKKLKLPPTTRTGGICDMVDVTSQSYAGNFDADGNLAYGMINLNESSPTKGKTVIKNTPFWAIVTYKGLLGTVYCRFGTASKPIRINLDTEKHSWQTPDGEDASIEGKRYDPKTGDVTLVAGGFHLPKPVSVTSGKPNAKPTKNARKDAFCESSAKPIGDMRAAVKLRTHLSNPVAFRRGKGGS